VDIATLKPSALEKVAEQKDWERRRAEKSKTGGVYVPPHKLKEMTSNQTDHGTEKFQRLQWDALRKSVNGLPLACLLSIFSSLILTSFPTPSSIAPSHLLPYHNLTTQTSIVFPAIPALIAFVIPALPALIALAHTLTHTHACRSDQQGQHR
jgi:hypothetical protein